MIRDKILRYRTKFNESIRVKRKNLIRLIISIICLCGLLYQAGIIYTQFMLGKTIISLEIGRLPDERPPALTICYPAMFSIERAAQYDPRFTELNQRNLQSFRDVQNQSKMWNIYVDTFLNYTNEMLENNGLDMNVLYNNISVQYKALDGSQTIWLTARGGNDKQTVLDEFEIFNEKSESQYKFLGDPYETIFIRQWGNKKESINIGKCLTFFSQAQKSWRNFQQEFGMITFRLNWFAANRTFPFDPVYFLAMHSPNHLPSFLLDIEFKRIDFKKYTTIKYSEQRIQRLGKGYDTDCHSYGSDTNYTYYRMRSDCVSDCYQDKLRQICKVDRGLLMSKYLIRKDNLIDGNDRLISCYDQEYNQMSFSIKIDCEKMCKIECNVRYYPIEVKTTNIGKNYACNIFHNEYPDIFIMHDWLYLQLWRTVGHVVRHIIIFYIQR